MVMEEEGNEGNEKEKYSARTIAAAVSLFEYLMRYEVGIRAHFRGKDISVDDYYELDALSDVKLARDEE